MNQLLKVVGLVQCVLVLVKDVNQSATKTFQQTLQVIRLWVMYHHQSRSVTDIINVTPMHLTINKHPTTYQCDLS